MKTDNLFLNHIYNTNDEGYKIIDKNFNIISCNEKYAQLNNQNSENLIGKKCYDYLCPDDCCSEECSFAQMLEGKESIERVFEKTSTNETKYYDVSIKPLKNKNNKILGIIECFTDITSTKMNELKFEKSEAQLRNSKAHSKECETQSRISEAQLKESEIQLRIIESQSRKGETQLRKSEAQLKESEYNLKESESQSRESEILFKKGKAARDDFFSLIAHDLRNPFTSILGFSELLIENITLYGIAEIEVFIKNINLSAQNALTLLENLLNWAVTQTGKLVLQPEKLILLLLIKETVKISNSAAQIKNISLNYDQLDEIEIDTDINMVKTILRNLISNAIKFTNIDGKINVSTIYGQDEVEITVADNGVGMTEETCNNLFELPVNITSIGTADERGTGLGLAVCKEFVEKLGGRIWVESEEGKGSDFKFTLPLHQPVFYKKETTF